MVVSGGVGYTGTAARFQDRRLMFESRRIRFGQQAIQRLQRDEPVAQDLRVVMQCSTVTGVSSDSMDRWSRWLLEHRFGGDAAQRERVLPKLLEFRDRVLAAAKIRPGDVVLDVGCGDGLLGMGALDAVGESGQVVFSDISSDLLNHCQAIVADLGLLDRCRFVHTGLPNLRASTPSRSMWP